MCQLSVPLANLQSSNYFVFSQPLTLSHEATAAKHSFIPDNCIQSVLHSCSACIILNLALVYHRQGQLGSAQCMQKAQKLYEMVLKPINGSSLNTEISLLVRIAAANNLAQICHENGEFCRAEEARSFMAHQLRLSELDDSLMEAFVLNALSLNAPTMAAAA
jgi:hypothetical protein